MSVARNKEIYTQWMDIQDVIGKASKWPHHIRKLFWTHNIRNFDRLLVATFVRVNGLNPEQFMEWAMLMHLCRDNSAVRHFRFLFNAFENSNNPRYQKYYSWNVTTGRYEHVDGTFHVYTHK